MGRHEYYERLKALARTTREIYGLRTARVLRSDLRRIYRAEGIRIYKWPYKLKKLRGAYMDDGAGPAVLLNAALPPEPIIFTMGHELKHHLDDRGTGLAFCGDSNATEHIEIGAEVFAAELIFPEALFRGELEKMGITPANYVPEALVKLKAGTSTTMSYAAMAKRIEYLGFVEPGTHAKIRWRTLEFAILGVPVYRRPGLRP